MRPVMHQRTKLRLVMHQRTNVTPDHIQQLGASP
jgi:hypothetical protein